MIDRAGRRDHDGLRQVALAVKGAQPVQLDRAHHLRAADHRATERVLAEDGLAEHVEDPVLGVVFVHRDLLEHHLALGREVFEARLPDHLPHHVAGRARGGGRARA